MSAPAYKIAERLSPRTSLRVGGHWHGLVYTHKGTRVVECEHHHRKATAARACAQRMLEKWAGLAAACGQGLPE